MVIIAIDPGFERLGIAVIKKETGQKETLIFSECFKTSKNDAFEDRLVKIGNHFTSLLTKHKPEILAIETLFLSSNKTTAMRVSETRGALIYLAKNAGLEVFEYNPGEIKMAITGSGSADKRQVMSMVPRLIKIEGVISSDDELDAVACGLTHFAFNKKR